MWAFRLRRYRASPGWGTFRNAPSWGPPQVQSFLLVPKPLCSHSGSPGPGGGTLLKLFSPLTSRELSYLQVSDFQKAWLLNCLFRNYATANWTPVDSTEGPFEYTKKGSPQESGKPPPLELGGVFFLTRSSLVGCKTSGLEFGDDLPLLSLHSDPGS